MLCSEKVVVLGLCVSVWSGDGSWGVCCCGLGALILTYVWLCGLWGLEWQSGKVQSWVCV